MLLVLAGLFYNLVGFSAALPMWISYPAARLSIQHSTSVQHKYSLSKRTTGNWGETLKLWAPSGVSGHIDLMETESSNGTVSSHTYSPYTIIQSVPNNQATRKIAEIGYSRPILASSLEPSNHDAYILSARPFGWGTKFWMLKSHDVDCYAGSEFASSYNVNSTGGVEYPVVLRSPLGSDKHDGIFAYCVTYDPNPGGSAMTLGTAPCGSISCEPLPQAKDPSLSFPSVFRNPDGTFAPKFFTTRPCNYLDPNCHVSQIFLYNAATGAVRPMYHPEGMDGFNRTWISSGQPSTIGHEPILKRVEMVFRKGDMRALPGWPEPNPALVVADPGFDAQNVSRPIISNISSVTDGARVYVTYAAAPPLVVSSSALDTGFSSTMASVHSREMPPSSMPTPTAAGLATHGASALATRPVWLRPAVTLRLDER